MPLSDMPDLVCNDASKLCLAIEVSKQASVDVDETTGQGKRIDVRRVQQGEGELLIGHAGVGDQSRTYFVNVGLQFGIVVDADIFNQLLVLFSSIGWNTNGPPTDGNRR